MSALARYFLSIGMKVYGSDSGSSQNLDQLEKEGIYIFRTQKAENLQIDTIEEFIFSEAIEEDNPERMEASRMGISQKKYFEKLGEISKEYTTICVSGTHGKSSTTAMIATILRDAGKDITAIVGANVFEWGNTNFLTVRGTDSKDEKKYFVVESCEYRESFLMLSPQMIVITTVEPEHLDYFQTEERYYEAFQKFLQKLPEFGVFVADFSDASIRKILPPNFRTRRSNAHDVIDAVPPLQMQGEHQRQNAGKAMAAIGALKVDLEIAQTTLAKFTGVARRFERKGERKGVLVFDDYAHHPTEIIASVTTAKKIIIQTKRKKLWVVFQPHQFSRTADFLEGFAKALSNADEVLIPNIFRVRDSDEQVERVSVEAFVKKISSEMLIAEKNRSNVWGRGTRPRGAVFYKKRVRYSKTFEKTLKILREEAFDGDVILVMGAGPVGEIAEKFVEESGNEN
jgi:UDP-N-acetylmuramate--alanine ligase